MARRINAEGLALLRQWEGCRLDAYRDIGGVWTIGYGHTRTARQGMTITQEQAESLLREDLHVFEAAVADAVHVDLTDNQFAALVSWAYNVGVSAMRRSSLIRRLNAGDYDAVPAELAKWNRVKGQVVRGLSNRRAAEAGLWARGAFVASRNIAPTDGGLSAKEAATRTGTGKAAVTVGTAGVVSTIAQHSDAISALGFVGPVIGVALVVAAAVLFILWRRGHI
jgi:lysozyme